MYPRIDFRHVLTELSVNRTDPCEVVRELISNAYDADAGHIRLATIHDNNSFVFFDDGIGLDRSTSVNGITPYEAFFSIGKSTKKRGDGGIGYKCQGSKLCFASNRVLVITRCKTDSSWFYRVVENPRETLAVDSEIAPNSTDKPWAILSDFLTSAAVTAKDVVDTFDESFFSKSFKTGTLVAVRGFDTDNFGKYFNPSPSLEDSYLYNYIRHFTRHGDTRKITKEQGFKAVSIHQVEDLVHERSFSIWDGSKYVQVPFGFEYLLKEKEKDIKGPLEVARLRDGRFSTRAAKRITFGGASYCFILVVDGNRRAHDGYVHLDRKGAGKSGIRLADQRGLWISASGIKICSYNGLFARLELEDYAVMGESEGISHFHFIIDGNFELVTNRNSLSRSASMVIENTEFIGEIKKFLDTARETDTIFRDMINRLRREQSEARLSQQIDILNSSKDGMKERERFEIDNRLYVSPMPGEEYLVGVLFAELGSKVDEANDNFKYWKRVLTFSTQGIDSIATRAPKSLKRDDLLAVEYKYYFSNSGPFNHALCLVDFIVAWEVDLDLGKNIRDEYGCFGEVELLSDGFWRIHDINHIEGDSYGDREVKVVGLKRLIELSFPGTKFKKP